MPRVLQILWTKIMNRLVVCVPEIIFLLGERLKNFLFPTNTFENRLSLRMKKGNIEQSLGLCKTEVLLVRKQCREKLLGPQRLSH